MLLSFFNFESLSFPLSLPFFLPFSPHFLFNKHLLKSLVCIKNHAISCAGIYSFKKIVSVQISLKTFVFSKTHITDVNIYGVPDTLISIPYFMPHPFFLASGNFFVYSHIPSKRI